MKRIDQLLTASGLYSRKEGKELLKKGRVTVDGQRVTQGTDKFPPTAQIAVDGKNLLPNTHIWIMLHKPQGYVSATEDRREATVLELLPPEYQQRGLFPVGRLDKDTEGLLLLTDDGDMAHRILSPRKKVPKVYLVHVEGNLRDDHISDMAQGLQLGDGLLCHPAKLEILPPGDRGYITLTQGKYHQIKRMMACLGTPVIYLKRIAMAGLSLDSTLELGQWRPLTLEEIGTISQDLGDN